jgi:hypothetical protein
MVKNTNRVNKSERTMKRTVRRPKARPGEAASTKKQSAKAEAPKAARTSKKETVMTLLRRADGASAQEIMEATGWQRHSVRGFLSILGKTLKIERSKEGRYCTK